MNQCKCELRFNLIVESIQLNLTLKSEGSSSTYYSTFGFSSFNQSLGEFKLDLGQSI